MLIHTCTARHALADIAFKALHLQGPRTPRRKPLQQTARWSTTVASKVVACSREHVFVGGTGFVALAGFRFCYDVEEYRDFKRET